MRSLVIISMFDHLICLNRNFECFDMIFPWIFVNLCDKTLLYDLSFNAVYNLYTRFYNPADRLISDTSVDTLISLTQVTAFSSIFLVYIIWFTIVDIIVLI